MSVAYTTAPALVSVDWGTSSFRAQLVGSDCAILDRVSAPDGILAAAARGFAETLAHHVGPWLRMHEGLSIVMSGMIGSRQGWHEVAYVTCPAAFGDLASHMASLSVPTGLPASAVFIAPGLSVIDGSGTPDVMRGEECQIFGALDHAGISDRDGPASVVLPGTHSKWARVDGNRIAAFRSYMTGEIFAALANHTILSRLITADGSFREASFREGCRIGAAAGGPGALLSRVFSTRTRGLFGLLAEADGADYLSGILIGAEIAEALRDAAGSIVLVGGTELSRRYETALRDQGIVATVVDPDCVVRAHVALARARGVLEI